MFGTTERLWLAENQTAAHQREADEQLGRFAAAARRRLGHLARRATGRRGWPAV